MAKIFALAMPVATHKRVEGCCINLANQAIAPSSDRRNVVELLRVRELREFQRRFANYKADLSKKP